MSFLQPIILWGLPLIALPVLIHLINQHRHRTINWGAMFFLRKARRMTTGVAKLRFWLILLMRMLAVAGLLFAVSRPLASGWLGLTAGGAADTAVIILDRSASMEERSLQSARSKRETALERIDRFLQTVGRTTKVVLIENAHNQPIELDDAKQLGALPDIASTATASDIPAMLETALDYVSVNETGRTDIWLCSDQRARDWDADSGRWDALRQEFSKRDGVRFYLLNYPDVGSENLSVRVSNVQRRDTNSSSAELLLDLDIFRGGTDQTPREVPVNFVIDGARTTVNISLTGSRYVQRGMSFPIDQSLARGAGRVELPNDTNPQDNVFHFVFAEPPLRKSLIVSSQEDVGELLRLAAATPADKSFSYAAKTVAPHKLSEADLDNVALVLWQAELPDGNNAEILQQHVDAGRSVVFFPPETPNGKSLFGGNWSGWNNANDDAETVATWRTDIDLLQHTDNGTPLPVGGLKAWRVCILNQQRQTVLAGLDNQQPLLTRALTDRGAVYFCSTLPAAGYSNLATDGVVLYVLIHRALNSALGSLGAARFVDAGTNRVDLSNWKTANQDDDVLLSDRNQQSGVYQNEDLLLAMNRPEAEDDPQILTSGALEGLFGDLRFTQIQDEAGSELALASEIWRTFLIAMILALLVEAVLCLPDRSASETGNSFAGAANA